MRPLEGTIIVEIGAWIAGPSACALLCDWGAEVWKVEPPRGDPFRAVISSQGYSSEIPNAPFTVDNRGKRSVVLDLREGHGRAALDQMLAKSDVLLTNMRMRSLEKLGLSCDALLARHPHLICSVISGYGSVGPDRNRPGYDIGAFAGRTGILHQMRAGDVPPTALPLGFGDHVVALATAAGVLAAMVERGRTGRGQLVESSLMRTGAFALGWELAVQLMLGKVPGATQRIATKTPLFNCYQSADGQWFWLLGVEADRHFPALVAALERPDLLSDSRFATSRDRRRNTSEFVEVLDAAFAGQPMDVWVQRFDEHRVWWEPVHSPAQVVEDEQAVAAACFVDIEGTEFQTVSGPIDFAGEQAKSVAAAPELGADTESVLRAAGCTEDLVQAVLRRAVPGQR
ncbi:Hydroxyproline dehydratase putative [Mycolicibacterium fortuitum]|uniref:Hydroxyproline dehydratase putative n=1 Tax=Mycolicibacterium fortuitum TaxID=1766 RepID=A0A0N9XQ56_MYCFO|nr:CoA transferase [Mycolicibacterium fortuitum]ALI25835.1 Hydroxyproline dehydratase putative [Mycolicibacterium fortuitum]